MCFAAVGGRFAAVGGRFAAVGGRFAAKLRAYTVGTEAQVLQPGPGARLRGRAGWSGCAGFPEGLPVRHRDQAGRGEPDAMLSAGRGKRRTAVFLERRSLT